MSITNCSVSRGPRYQGLTKQLMILLAICSGVSVSLAHPNAARVGGAVQTVCSASPPPNVTACSDVSGGVEDAAQLAPDKLVMQSVAALDTVQRQFSLVDQRLDELRHVKLGSNRVSFSGSQRSVESFLTRALGKQAPSRTVLLASMSAALPDILVAQSDAKDLATSAGESTATSTGTAFPSNDVGVYFRLEADRSDTDATSFDPGFDSRSAGLTVGADYKVSTNAVLGGALSYANDRSTLDTTDGTPSGDVKTRGGSVSLYGAYYPTAAAYVDATLVYGRNRYESIRSMPVLTDTAIGNTEGEQYGLSLGGGYSFLASNLNYGPYVRVSMTKAKVDAFTEQTNNTDSNLAVQAQTAESLVGVLGGQISYAISRNWGVLVPNARIEWEHQHQEDRTRNILARFAADPSAGVINIETTPPDGDYFNLGLGVASHFGVGQSAFIYYQTVLGRAGTTSHALTAELRLEF